MGVRPPRYRRFPLVDSQHQRCARRRSARVIACLIHVTPQRVRSASTSSLSFLSCAFCPFLFLRYFFVLSFFSLISVCHMRATSPQQMQSKSFEFHIWVTSVPTGTKPIDVIVGEDDEIGSVEMQERTPLHAAMMLKLLFCARAYWPSVFFFFVFSFLLVSGAFLARTRRWRKCVQTGTKPICIAR